MLSITGSAYQFWLPITAMDDELTALIPKMKYGESHLDDDDYRHPVPTTHP